MFSAFGGLAPRFETRRALLILNMQNDSFDVRAGNMMVNPDHDFADRIRAMVPFYRRLGDIVWVRTEYAVDRPSSPEHSAASTGDDDGVPTASSSPASRHEAELPAPSGRAQKAMRKAAARARTRQRSGVLGEIDQDDDAAEADAYLKKPRKGQRPAIYCAGTRGAAIIDSLLPLVDERTDMMVVKHHYSALDATPLLMALRMKLVTHLYLCGCLSNVSILTTAQDAVRHGFEVTVVEDCMGYRSEVKHLEVMRMMADLLGVSGTDSEEIIDDAGGRDPPDADELVITGPGLEGIKGSVVQAPGSRPQSIGGREKLEFRSRTAEAPTAKDQEHHEISHVEHARPSPPTSTSKDRIGEGDSSIIYDVLSPSLVADAFGKIRDEVQWQAMLHRSGEVPRRVAVQGWVDHERNRPLYRHPADFAPPLLHFTETVDRIRLELAKCLRQPFNHVLIQLYRDGEDNISEHSDKVGRNLQNCGQRAKAIHRLWTFCAAPILPT
jgi:nicotinamidase-related amidase